MLMPEFLDCALSFQSFVNISFRSNFCYLQIWKIKEEDGSVATGCYGCMDVWSVVK